MFKKYSITFLSPLIILLCVFLSPVNYGSNEAFANEQISIPSGPKGEMFTYGDGRGFVNLTWEPVPNATGYKVWVFNGIGYESIDVGNTTSWSTKGKAIWPTEDEITQGKFNIHKDVNKPGSELVLDPSLAYRNAGTAYKANKNYYFRISAYNSTEESAYSSEFYKHLMPSLALPTTPKADSYLTEDSAAKTGYVDLQWNPVENAKGYKVWIFNGKEYESIDVGNTVNWNSFEMGVWPTQGEISDGRYKLHLDGTGSDLAVDPSQVYINSKGNYGVNNKNYWFKVSAYNDEGETERSNYVKPIIKESVIPTESITPNEEKAIYNELKKKITVVDELLIKEVAENEESKEKFIEQVNQIHIDIDDYLSSVDTSIFYDSEIQLEMTEKLGELDLKVEQFNKFSALATSWRYGDILYYGIGNKNAAGEKSFTGHTAVLSTTDYYVIEAARTKNNGAKVHHWNRDKLWSGASGIRQYKVTSKLGKAATTDKRKQAVKFGLDQVGEPYALRTTIGSTKKWYCSKLTNAMWDDAGYNLQSINAYKINGLLAVIPYHITVDANVRLKKSWGKSLPGKI